MLQRTVAASVIALALATPIAACSSPSGGSGESQGSTGETVAGAASDLSIAENIFAPGGLIPSLGEGTAPGSGLGSMACHPELFARTVEYSEALNYHVNLFLQHMDDLMQTEPVTSGVATTWIYVGKDADLKLVVWQTGLGVYGLTLGVAPPGSHSYTTVVSGTVDGANPDDISKQLMFDLDALHGVLPAGPGDQSSGRLALHVERLKNADGSDRERVVTYTLTSFVPVYGDPRGPRSGTIDLLDEPGVGGAMLYDATAVFSCPPNPLDLASDARTFARWTVQGNTVSARADAIASGGQMADGDRWVGLSCNTESMIPVRLSPPLQSDDGYWLIKEESSSGATLEGNQRAVQDGVSTDPACDPAFGAVTDLYDDRNDPTIPTTLPADAFPGEL
jgi:hypothetical protein